MVSIVTEIKKALQKNMEGDVRSRKDELWKQGETKTVTSVHLATKVAEQYYLFVLFLHGSS